MPTLVNPTVQGTALIFYPKHDWVNGGVLLQPDIITSRYLKPKECNSYFIENTNLDSIPNDGIGTLVAFSRRDNRSRENKLWSLGVLIFLHPEQTIIAPCIGIRLHYHPLSLNRYKVSDSHITFGTSFPNEDFSLIYLNSLNNVNCCGDDGFIQSDINGPDVLFDLTNIPSNILSSQYKNAKSTHSHFYEMTHI